MRKDATMNEQFGRTVKWNIYWYEILHENSAYSDKIRLL